MGILHHFASVLLLGASASGQGLLARQLQTVDSDVTAQQLVNILLGSNAASFTTSNVSLDCPVVSSGVATFGGSDHAFVDLGISDGENVVLSTGSAAVVEAIVNVSPVTSTITGGSGNPDVSAATGSATFDACCLSFDIVSSISATVGFSYIFMSEEYNEFVDAGFNDGFLLLVNGENVATLESGAVVSIDSINDEDNSGLYNDNGEANSGNFNTEYDGFTNVLATSPFDLEGGVPSTIKIVIADAGDASLDSSIVLQGGSFTFGKEYSLSLQCVVMLVVVMSGDARSHSPRKL